jgi:hypothetical protein
MTPERYGVTFADGTQIVSLHGDEKGWWFIVRGKRQEVEMRATPSGLLRIGKVRKSGRITAQGVK